MSCLVSSAEAEPSAKRHDRHALAFTGYDDDIRRAVRNYWPDGPDWKWWKAQLYQESAFDRFAVSHVGAAGLCQVMPATAADWRKAWFPPATWGEASPHDAKFCIIGGARYMRQLQLFPDWKGWRDRDRPARAAYNAGAGNIRKAIRPCAARGGAATDWAAIAACLPAITGKHAAETIGYVSAIERHRGKLGPIEDAPPIAIVCTWKDHRGGCARSASR